MKSLNSEARRAPEAVYWRRHPLAAPGALFWIEARLEAVFGKIAMSDHRTDNVPGLLTYAATFANGEEVAQRSSGSAPDEAILPELESERVEARRLELRSLLHAAVSGSLEFEEQPDEFLESLLKQMGDSSITWMTSLDRGIGWRVYGRVKEPGAFIAVIATLLLNKEQRQLLGECQNPKCSRFFLVERTEGKPRKLYCGEDCMRAVNDAGSAARQRSRYKRQKAAEMLVERWHGRAPAGSDVRKFVLQAFHAQPDALAEQLAEHATVLLKNSRRNK
jgi:predicted RNA-binding Zn ribbon-like protein